MIVKSGMDEFIISEWKAEGVDQSKQIEQKPEIGI